MVTECEVHDALKQVGPNKSPGLDGLLYERYFMLLHMFVTIMTDMFNHWFTQGAIPGKRYHGRDHIAEERWYACLGGLRRLQAHNSAYQS